MGQAEKIKALLNSSEVSEALGFGEVEAMTPAPTTELPDISFVADYVPTER